MYLGMITLTMLILPLLSIGGEYALAPDADLAFLIGKWFVFWAMGVRLMLAGLRQILDPAFTAKTIFKIKDPDARKVVVELGFGNVAIALLGLLSVYRTDWVTPALSSGLSSTASRACSMSAIVHGRAWRISPWRPTFSSRPWRSST